MKKRLIIITVIGSMILAPYTNAAPENPNVGSSFTNRNTVPSANQQRRMITRPNSYTDNQVVTGNVGGLKYFRGVVPYSSSYYSGAYANDSGSAAVSSFLRRSTDPIVNDRNPGAYQSFYQPSRTVSSYGTRPDGSSGLSRPTIPRQGSTTSYIIPGLPQLRNTQFTQRPLAGNAQELDALLTRQIKLKEEAKLDSARQKKEISENLNLYDTLTPEQIKELLDKQDTQVKDDQKTEEPTLKPEEEIFAEFMKEYTEALKEQKPIQKPHFSETASDAQENQTETGEEPPTLLEPDDWRVKEGKAVLGEHKTFLSLADAKIKMYLETAQNFLKEGKFYKAADTYALAAVWNAEDARIHFGQSIALFAAGEYMSSAFYLSHAFELDGQMASIRYDIPGIINSRDTYEDRLLEIVQWQQQSNSPELAFLLAYLYYQDGKTENAVRYINAAYDAMPDSSAVVLLKNIIIPAPKPADK